MKRLLALAPLALLAACADDPTAPEPAPLDTASATPAASPTPSASAVQATQIPAAFVGLWDAEEGQCAQWSDAQLTVEPTRLQFYESTGEVTAVRQPDANTIVVTMAMSGEGETWTEETTYRLLDGGKVLASDFATDEGGEPFRRRRCDAFVEMPVE